MATKASESSDGDFFLSVDEKQSISKVVVLEAGNHKTSAKLENMHEKQ